MDAKTLKKANDIQRQISELEYFKTRLESIFGNETISVKIEAKFGGQTMTFPPNDIYKMPQDGLCSEHKDRFYVLISQLVREKENELRDL